jgi:2-dehydro-3-deoxyglucarate aldolase/4-hydroxy-2-oxoheptanedioate aldolase
MSMPENAFKRGLSAGRPMIGTWFMSGSPTLAEAMGFAGFDFLVLDMEHSAVDAPQALPLLQAVAATPASSVIRLPWNDPIVVKRVLDSGAQTLMFPYIETAADAKRAVASTRYPPAGLRGVAAMHRGSRYGSVPNYMKRANDEMCVIIQLESVAAVSRLPEIAAVEGVDSIFIGPADLSASMGMIGELDRAEVQKALADAARACRAVGKPCGIVGANPDVVQRYREYGYTWTAVASDLAMMLSRAREFAAALRAGR